VVCGRVGSHILAYGGHESKGCRGDVGGKAPPLREKLLCFLHPTTDMVHDCCCSPVQGILLHYGNKWFLFRVYSKSYLEDKQVNSNQHRQIQFF